MDKTAPIPNTLTGRVLGGKLRLDRVIGSGAMGAVYQAHHLGLDKTIAIKILHQMAGGNEAGASRFKAEARAASRIDHPNVVQILDFGEDGPDYLLYLAMEFLNGQSLQERVGNSDALSETQACWIMAQILSALATAHDHGVIHRDMKPANVMLIEKPGDEGMIRDVVKVCDFGLAKLRNSDGTDYEGSSGPLTQEGAVFGTPAYMSPEQARGEELDARSDLYSCGVILYRIVTGQTPFQGKSLVDVLMKQVSEQPPPPRSLMPSLSVALEGIILKALAKDPKDRYLDARAMRKAVMANMAEQGDADSYAGVMAESMSNPSPTNFDSVGLARALPVSPFGDGLSDTLHRPVPHETPAVANSFGPQDAAITTSDRLFDAGSNSTALKRKAGANRPPYRLILGAVIGVSLGVVLAMMAVGTPQTYEPGKIANNSAVAAKALTGVVAPPPAIKKPVQAALPAQKLLPAKPVDVVAQDQPPMPEKTSAKRSSPPNTVKTEIAAKRPKIKPKKKINAKISQEKAIMTDTAGAGKNAKTAMKPKAVPQDVPLTKNPVRPSSKVSDPPPKALAPSLGPNSVFRFSLAEFNVEGGVSKQKIRRALMKKESLIHDCLRKSVLANTGPRQGQFTFRLTLGDRGRLRKLTIEGSGKSAQACLKTAISSARFPRADTGRVQILVRMEYTVAP